MPTPYAEPPASPYAPPRPPAHYPAHRLAHAPHSVRGFWGEPPPPHPFERKQAAQPWWHRLVPHSVRGSFGAEAMPSAFERKVHRHLGAPRSVRGPWFSGDPALLPAAVAPHPEHSADGNPRPHGHHHHHARGPSSSHHGDDDTFEPNYGAADTGIDLDVSYDAGAGMDPFAAAVFDDPGKGMPPAEWLALQAPTGIDVYDPREQIPNARNYLAEFGFEDQLYSGFGPAAVIGCEIGCGLDDAALKG